jgi:hypothetical protein
VLQRLTFRSFRDGRLDLSKSYCLPGKAGGTPKGIRSSSQCENFYLGAVFTPELQRRIANDRLVKKTFNIIEILHDPKTRDKFFREIFHYALRIA